MRKIVFPLALLASAFVLPLAAHADAVDDFVLTGNGLDITFSLPASPPGNEMTCPPSAPSCLPGSETFFTASTLVTTNGVTSTETLDFPTLRFGGGLDIGATRFFGNQALYTPDAATPTFLLGTFDVSIINSGGFPPILDYSLTITPASTAPTPEPSTLALLSTGVLGLVSLARRKHGHASR
jgi:hypothetical protein